LACQIGRCQSTAAVLVHLAGPFFSEGSFTKNSANSVDEMMRLLDDWANGRRPKDLAKRARLLDACVEARKQPLQAMDREIDLARFVGRWFVVANIPTPFDKGTANNVEDYAYDEGNGLVHVSFVFSDPDLKKTSMLQQRARVVSTQNTEWQISPKFGIYLPVGFTYLIAYCADDYSSTIIGVPNRAFLWIMTREPNPKASVLEGLVDTAQSLGFDVSSLNYVPQRWSERDLA